MINKKTLNSKIQFNAEQKQVHADFHQFDVNFVLGGPGSGKTQSAVQIAIESLIDKSHKKIIIARPMIDDGSMGALPGEIEDKMKPWIAPLEHCFVNVIGRSKYEKLRSTNTIEILPVSHAKGITYMNSVVIVDECQDMIYEDFYTMLSRLGKDSKLIFTGSKEQVNRKFKHSTCIHNILRLEDQTFIGFNILKANHRNEAIFKVLDFLDKNK